MGKILHILTDEKFTDYVIFQFEAPEMQSEFVLIPANFTKGECLVKQIDKIRIVKQNSSEFTDLLLHLGDYSGIVLHGLFWRFDEDILRAVPDNVKVAWMFWGGEIYSRSELNDTFLTPITRFLCHVHSWSKRGKKKAGYQLPIELFQRIDYCLTDEIEEFEYAKHFVQSNRMKHLWYNYYSLEKTIGSLLQNRCLGSNVFFCNSAAPKNNMFDTVVKLVLPWNRHKLQKKQIIMPLSYGDPWIKNAMIKIGKVLFGHRFVPIVDYLPLEEYNKLMLDCGTIILPYWQPAAQGNIITSLWLGMRVYLSERSMSYHYFKRIGCFIYSLENDFKRAKDPFAPLTNEQVEYNRTILRQNYDIERMQEKNKEIVKILTA